VREKEFQGLLEELKRDPTNPHLRQRMKVELERIPESSRPKPLANVSLDKYEYLCQLFKLGVLPLRYLWKELGLDPDVSEWDDIAFELARHRVKKALENMQGSDASKD